MTNGTPNKVRFPVGKVGSIVESERVAAEPSEIGVKVDRRNLSSSTSKRGFHDVARSSLVLRAGFVRRKKVNMGLLLLLMLLLYLGAHHERR